MRMLRRVVTGHDPQGRSTVLFDGPPVSTFGDQAAELWATDETPARLSGGEDASLRPIQMDPPPQGTIFRYIEVPPEAAPVQAPEAFDQTLAAMNAEHTRQDTSRHPRMHRTDTIDYVVVLAGPVTMILDDGEVELQTHDILVQRGTNHAWVNTGQQPALLLAAQISAEPRQRSGSPPTTV